MEAGDSGTRQRVPLPSHSRHSSASRLEQPPTQSSRGNVYDPVNRRLPDQPTMAAATVLPPASHYQSQPSYPSGYPQQASNMVSSEPRRHSDEGESSTRQSLPSISEVICGARNGQYPPPIRPPLQPVSSLPSPFTSAAPRHYSDGDKHQSPHAPSAYAHRQEPLPPFSGSPRLPFNGRPGLPPVTDRRPTPPTTHDGLAPHHLSETQKTSEPLAMNGNGNGNGNGNYHPQPPPPHATVPYQPGQLPPGQQPLPPYPVSPRHNPLHMPNYDSRAPPSRHDDAEYISRTRYESASNRPFESWSYQEALGRIGTCSRTVFNFAEAYSRIAGEQHGSQPIPERLPTEREVGEMLSNVEYLKRSLEQVREVILASIQSERAREGAKAKGLYEEDPDIHMYSDPVKPHYMAEVKKRRGRAAPPGRCHSCNRIDTPEWRRGPDGARTLCNACGLHYAKLERKRQLEARSLRPKPEDRS